jgi:hypothetical protein
MHDLAIRRHIKNRCEQEWREKSVDHRRPKQGPYRIDTRKI